MPTYLRRSSRVTVEAWQRFFEDVGSPSSGFSFDCDARGTIACDATGWPLDHDGQRLSEDAVANLKACRAGAVNGHPVIDRGVEDHSWSYMESAIIACFRCTRPVELYRDAVACSCGQYYGLFGQPLSDPSNWGEETGETAADILRGGDPFDGD